MDITGTDLIVYTPVLTSDNLTCILYRVNMTSPSGSLLDSSSYPAP
jgi:hypothetical protein